LQIWEYIYIIEVEIEKKNRKKFWKQYNNIPLLDGLEFLS